MRKRVQPVEMTEEERLRHERYIQELTDTNEKIVRKICTVLWCVALVAWGILLVLDVLHEAGAVKIVFHAVATVLTAWIALPRVKEWIVGNRKSSDDTET